METFYPVSTRRRFNVLTTVVDVQRTLLQRQNDVVGLLGTCNTQCVWSKTEHSQIDLRRLLWNIFIKSSVSKNYFEIKTICNKHTLSIESNSKQRFHNPVRTHRFDAYTTSI